LKDILKESGEENERLFDFTVKFNLDIKSMADEGHELVDLRAEGGISSIKSGSLLGEIRKTKI